MLRRLKKGEKFVFAMDTSCPWHGRFRCFASSALFCVDGVDIANSVMMCGVNLADGQIKGYGDPKGNKANNRLFCVQGDCKKRTHGTNSFVANGDASITDKATGLMWQEADNGVGVNWGEAPSGCAAATSGGHKNWCLPDAKELQSLVDYTRLPRTTSSAVIAPLFNATSFTNEAGQIDYGYYWSATTHKNAIGKTSAAVYLNFGRAMGYMKNSWLDVHGAGARRSDPKKVANVTAGKGGYKLIDAHDGPAISHGPQGDAMRGLNLICCVRDVF